MWNAFRRVESSRDHHGLAMIEGRRSGVRVSRSATSVVRGESNQFSNVYLVGRTGGGGTLAVLS